MPQVIDALQGGADSVCPGELLQICLVRGDRWVGVGACNDSELAREHIKSLEIMMPYTSFHVVSMVSRMKTVKTLVIPAPKFELGDHVVAQYANRSCTGHISVRSYFPDKDTWYYRLAGLHRIFTESDLFLASTARELAELEPIDHQALDTELD